MKKDVVIIKGVSEGIYIDIIGDDLEEIKKSLKKKYHPLVHFRLINIPIKIEVSRGQQKK